MLHTESGSSTEVLTSNGYRLDSNNSCRLGRLLPVPESERGDREALQQRFQRDGYLFFSGFFDPDTVMRFRRHYFTRLAASGLTRYGTDPGEGIAASNAQIDRAQLRRTLFHDLVPGGEYEALCTHPLLVGFHRWFLDAEEVHLHRRKIIRHVGPGETGIGTATQAHYDLVYLREGTSNVVSAWIPLGDVPIRRGPLIYLEGSHHHVLREEATQTRKHPAASITADLPRLAETYDARWLVTDFMAGDVVFHSAYIIHASLDNTDPEGLFRLSTDIRYQASAEPVDQRWQNHWHDQDGL